MTNILNETDTYTWTGSGNLVLERLGTKPPSNEFLMLASILQSHNMMNMQFIVANSADGYTPCNQDHETVVTTPEGTFTTDFSVAMGLCFPYQNFILNLDDNATIQANSFAPPANTCNFPNNFSKGTIQWESIPAKDNTAPDPLSAR